MNEKFMIHNLFKNNSIKYFNENDPNLKGLQKEKLIYESPLIEKLPQKKGIYILLGGRQVGKTTLTKQWISLILKKTNPFSVCYLTGDIILDFNELLNHCLEAIENQKNKNETFYLIIDEVTYIKEWDRAIKFLADGGYIENAVVLITGSDSIVLKDAMLRFPGRRGNEDQYNFHLHPLSFKEAVDLKNINNSEITNEFLLKEWNEYLIHGGYLKAINEFVSELKIRKATLRTYSEWIRGDFIKNNKKEYTLKEIFKSILKRQCSQVSWNALSKELSTQHVATLISYLNMLESMGVIIILKALDQNKLSGAPKKAKKIHFLDPFIFHAINFWINPVEDPFQDQITKILKDISPALTESSAASHLKRIYEIYYIKTESEVDIAYLKNETFYPVEIKWGNQIRKKDLKQILKYSNSKIWSKLEKEEFCGVKNLFLPAQIYNLKP